MEKLKVDFSDYPHVIYFEITYHWGSNDFLISENFETRTKSVFSTQRQYFNLNYILNLKQFKIEVI